LKELSRPRVGCLKGIRGPSTGVVL
jgi:hypothetical protein